MLGPDPSVYKLHFGDPDFSVSVWPVYLRVEVDGVPWESGGYGSEELGKGVVSESIVDVAVFPECVSRFLRGESPVELRFSLECTPTVLEFSRVSDAGRVRVRYLYDGVRVPKPEYPGFERVVLLGEVVGEVFSLRDRVESLLRGSAYPGVLDSEAWRRVRDSFLELDRAWREYKLKHKL